MRLDGLQRNTRVGGLSLNMDMLPTRSPRFSGNDLSLPLNGKSEKASLSLNFNDFPLTKPKLPSPSFSETSDA